MIGWRPSNRGNTHRRLVLVIGVSLLAASFVCSAQQQRRMARSGFVTSESLSAQATRIDAVRAGLRDHGYAEGKNISIEIRSAEGNYDRLPDLVVELVRLKVDVIVAFGTKAISAAKRTTTTIPIVGPVMGDPIAVGISASLARPGGNITGSAQLSPETAGKKLEVLREAVPHVRRIAVLINPPDATNPLQLQIMQTTATALNLELYAFEVFAAQQLEPTFALMAQRQIDAIVVPTGSFLRFNADAITALATRQRLPLIGSNELAEAGGLIGYGVNSVRLHRHAAHFVDKILKGAKPGDLPIEQASKLELVINLKTAKALGITVPQSLLVRADDVIR